MPILDLLDKKILYELDIDSRQPVSQLSKKLRTSRETINFRLKRLIENKTISSFYTIFDSPKMGWYYYKIYIKFKNITPEKEEEAIEYVRRQRNLAYLASMEGYYDCVALIMVQSTTELVGFLYPLMEKYGQYIKEKEIVVFLSTHRLNQRFMYFGGKKVDRKFSRQLGNYKVDESDVKIIQAISSSARLPIVEIAKKTGLEPSVVSYRLKKMERDRIIIGYATELNYNKLGFQYIQINISLIDPSVKQKLIGYFDATDKCIFAIEIVGRYDLVIEVVVQGAIELKQIMDGFRKNFADKCYDYYVSSITKEHVVLWFPISSIG